MTKDKSASRRDFLRRSSAATLATMAGPGSLSIISGREGGEDQGGTELTVSKNGFPPYQIQSQPGVEEYATMEAISNSAPVWSFSSLCYIYGASPDLMPGLVMQEGNRHPLEKIKLKKSWEIKYNLCGAESEMTCHTAYNDSQPMLPIHLIDGDPNTVWSSWGLLVPDGRPEWMRIDLPMESEVASVALVCDENFPSPAYGKSLPKELEVKTSRDAWHWETVYSSKEVPDQPVVEIKFQLHRAKQIWIIGQNFRKIAPIYDGYVFSIASVEVRDSAGNNLALVSRGASVTVSSVCYLELNDRFTQDALWASLNFDLGNKWLRIGGDNGSFMWQWVEHEKGKLELDPRGDYSVTDCVRHGVDVIVNLDFKGNYIYEDPPRKMNWPVARFREMNDNYNDPLPAADANPEMYQGYLRYIEYMVRQLKGRVAYFELGNEWNGWFEADHFVPAFFEPAIRIVKQVWPEAKVMLGSPAGFDQNAILDCLGRQRQYGIKGGKLILDGGEFQQGTIAVRENIQAEDATVSVGAEGEGTFGILLRYQEHRKYLAALCSMSDQTIMFYESDRHWGKPFAVKKFQNLGPNLKFVAKVQGSVASFTVSGDSGSVSTIYNVEHLTGAGAVALINRRGLGPVLFDNFQVEDARGRTLAKDDFNGPEGTVPNGWKYATGGPNPVKPGLAKRIDAIAWHPNDEPDAAYFAAVLEFQKKCRDLGFQGHFFATEIYAGSMYPPGEKSYPMLTSETQMAKYLVRSLVGHSGLGMEAGPCHPHFTGRVHPQALCQATWGTPTLNPCRPTMTYYMWRNVATLMDDFRASDFAVNFSHGEALLYFTFQRGENERMVSVWIDGPSKDGVVETKTDIVFPGTQVRRATVADIMNGTEQELEVRGNGAETVLEGMLVKDYPVFVTIHYTT
jgi:hypothetical protein